MQSSVENILMSLSLCHNMITSWPRSFCNASCMSLSQLEPGKTTIPNFILSILPLSYAQIPITEVDGIQESDPVKDLRQQLFVRVIISSRMKRSQRHQAKHPVHVIDAAIHKNDEQGDDQEQQQQAPPFTDLDQHFVKIALHKITSGDKRQHEQHNADSNKYGRRQGRKI